MLQESTAEQERLSENFIETWHAGFTHEPFFFILEQKKKKFVSCKAIA